MKNENPNIFCPNCGNHAQPTSQASSRKKAVIHDREGNNYHYISLTAEQIALLVWLENMYIFDNDRYAWEILTDREFEEI